MVLTTRLVRLHYLFQPDSHGPLQAGRCPLKRKPRWACSSVGQSGPLITVWSQVQILPGPPFISSAPKVQKSIKDRFQEMNARSASKGNPVDQIYGLNPRSVSAAPLSQFPDLVREILNRRFQAVGQIDRRLPVESLFRTGNVRLALTRIVGRERAVHNPGF